MGGCGFFDWEDPPMCRRARAIIPGLLRKKNEMEAEILKLNFRHGRLWRQTVVLLVVCIICIWVSVGLCSKKQQEKCRV